MLFVIFRQAYDTMVRKKLTRTNITGNKGVWQEDPLPAVHFRFILEAVLRESSIQTNGVIYQRRYQ